MRQTGAPLGELYSALAGAELEAGDANLTTPPIALLVHEPLAAIKIGYTPAAGVFGVPTQLARNSFASFFTKEYAAAAALETTDLFFLGAGLWDIDFQIAYNQPLGMGSNTAVISVAIGAAFTSFTQWWTNAFYFAPAGTSEARYEASNRRVCLAKTDEPLRFRLAVNNTAGTNAFGIHANWYCKKLR